uniref:Transmembrane protein 254 n=1 Tax=Zonotrichia albicollis TaxID=44394 RepID=A0A8D2N4Q1_ZONAL
MATQAGLTRLMQQARALTVHPPPSAWVTLWPSTIPYSYLGLFGTFLNYLVEHHHKWVCYGFWISWLIHIVEALYGIKLCQAKGITDPAVQFQWFVQTLLFGYASFGLLVSYKKRNKPPA